MNANTIYGVIVFIFLVVFSSGSYANKWNKRDVKYEIELSVPQEWEGTVNSAAAMWNGVNDADFTMEEANVTFDGSVLYTNLDPFYNDSPAHTYSITSNGYISRAYIKINSDYNGTTENGCNGLSYDLQSVLVHEFGHYAGLHHTSEDNTGYGDDAVMDDVILETDCYTSLTYTDENNLSDLYPVSGGCSGGDLLVLRGKHDLHVSP